MLRYGESLSKTLLKEDSPSRQHSNFCKTQKISDLIVDIFVPKKSKKSYPLGFISNLFNAVSVSASKTFYFTFNEISAQDLVTDTSALFHYVLHERPYQLRLESFRYSS